MTKPGGPDSKGRLPLAAHMLIGAREPCEQAVAQTSACPRLVSLASLAERRTYWQVQVLDVGLVQAYRPDWRD